MSITYPAQNVTEISPPTLEYCTVCFILAYYYLASYIATLACDVDHSIAPYKTLLVTSS